MLFLLVKKKVIKQKHQTMNVGIFGNLLSKIVNHHIRLKLIDAFLPKHQENRILKVFNS